MRRRAVVVLFTVIALLGGAVSHAVYVCPATAHAASRPTSEGHQDHPCGPASDRLPVCCQDPTGLSALPAKPARDEAPASGIAFVPVGVDAARALPADPWEPAFSCAFEHPPSPRGVRAHLFLKTLLI